MVVKQREPKPHPTSVTDLTCTPYFAAPPVPSQPVVAREGSSRERIRETPVEPVIAVDYLADRVPSVSESDLRFGGGLGLAAVLDVHAHPVRARLRRLDLLTVVAMTFVAAIATVMLTLAAALQH